MKALVTGGSGFIGSHLAELLLSHGYDVRCLVRRTSDLTWLRPLRVEYVYGDLFDEAALRDAVRGVDYVYHSAGLTKARRAQEYYRANTEGTANLLEAVAAGKPELRRFVLISSQAAAGPSPARDPITEEATPHPITDYGRSKHRAEEECLRHREQIPVTIVRPPVVYGPRDKDVFEFFHTMSRGLQPIVGFGEKYVSMVHVDDLVRGILLAGESTRAAGQTYFLSGKDVYGWRTIGDVTKEALGRSALRVRFPEAAVFVVAGVAELIAALNRKPALVSFDKARDMVQDHWTCDSSKAGRELGFEARVSLRDGIRSTIEWYRQQQWL